MRMKMKLTQISALVVATVLVLSTSGCTLLRSTTTPRSAIEQALMSTSAKDSLKGLDASQLVGKTYKIDATSLVSTDKDVITGMIDQQLVANGLKKGGDEAEVIIVPVAEVSGIDDADLLIGIPAIGVPTPGGIVGLPELALFKRSPQRGRNKLAVYGYNAKEGVGVLDHQGELVTRYYVRHRFLFFFNYNNTNINSPVGIRGRLY